MPNKEESYHVEFLEYVTKDGVKLQWRYYTRSKPFDNHCQ